MSADLRERLQEARGRGDIVYVPSEIFPFDCPCKAPQGWYVEDVVEDDGTKRKVLIPTNAAQHTTTEVPYGQVRWDGRTLWRGTGNIEAYLRGEEVDEPAPAS